MFNLAFEFRLQGDINTVWITLRYAAWSWWFQAIFSKQISDFSFRTHLLQCSMEDLENEYTSCFIEKYHSSAVQVSVTYGHSNERTITPRFSQKTHQRIHLKFQNFQTLNPNVLLAPASRSDGLDQLAAYEATQTAFNCVCGGATVTFCAPTTVVTLPSTPVNVHVAPPAESISLTLRSLSVRLTVRSTCFGSNRSWRRTDWKYATVGRDILDELRRSGFKCDLDCGLASFDGSWSGIGNSRKEDSCCDGKDLHIREPGR